MYTVCWTSNDADRWDRCKSRREVAALLIREGLEDSEDVLIFGPDADDCLMSTEDVLVASKR